MTLQELLPAIKLLNEKYCGEIMKPNDLKVKEFVAASRYPGSLSSYALAYMQSLGNMETALKTVEDKESLIIYVVFTKGEFPGYIAENYEFTDITTFLKSNEIDPTILAMLLIKNQD